jgi:hypothetical protein
MGTLSLGEKNTPRVSLRSDHWQRATLFYKGII